jgi:hypothetical protein
MTPQEQHDYESLTFLNRRLTERIKKLRETLRKYATYSGWNEKEQCTTLAIEALQKDNELSSIDYR